MNKLNTRKLLKHISEAVQDALDNVAPLSKEEIAERINKLWRLSKTYKKDITDTDYELSKIWNRGMGLQSFVQVLPEENVVLYNSLLTRNRDLERISELFPEFELVQVDKPYYSHRSLRYHYREQK